MAVMQKVPSSSRIMATEYVSVTYGSKSSTDKLSFDKAKINKGVALHSGHHAFSFVLRIIPFDFTVAV